MIISVVMLALLVVMLTAAYWFKNVECKSAQLKLACQHLKFDVLARRTHTLPEGIEPLIEDALPRIKVLESWDASGEARRHQVYAAMIKAHPDTPKMDIDLAIACAIRKIRET